jgi:hypothetical protein
VLGEQRAVGIGIGRSVGRECWLLFSFGISPVLWCQQERSSLHGSASRGSCASGPVSCPLGSVRVGTRVSVRAGLWMGPGPGGAGGLRPHPGLRVVARSSRSIISNTRSMTAHLTVRVAGIAR